MDPTELPGWQPFGEFPLDVEKVEVVEAGGRVWAQGEGKALELLSGEAWRAVDLSEVDVGSDLIRDGDGCIVAPGRKGGFVSIELDGSIRRLADELTGARLVSGSSSPLVLAGDGGLLLRLPAVGDEVQPVVLNEQVMRFNRLVPLGPRAASVPWIERVGSGGRSRESGGQGSVRSVLSATDGRCCPSGRRRPGRAPQVSRPC